MPSHYGVKSVVLLCWRVSLRAELLCLSWGYWTSKGTVLGTVRNCTRLNPSLRGFRLEEKKPQHDVFCLWKVSGLPWLLVTQWCVFHIFRNKLIRISNSNQRVETQGQNGACGGQCPSVEVSWWLSARYCFEPLLEGWALTRNARRCHLEHWEPQWSQAEKEGGDGKESKKLPATVFTCKSCQIHNFCLFLKLYIQHHSLFLGVHFQSFDKSIKS